MPLDGERFGASVYVSEDGKYIYVGSKHLQNKISKMTIFTQDYLKNDIVKYDNAIWQLRGIEGEEFQYNLIVLLVSGEYALH